MGTLRSLTDHSGRTVNGVLLGQPVERAGVYAWDDSALPGGWLNDDGTIDPAQEPVAGESE